MTEYIPFFLQCIGVGTFLYFSLWVIGSVTKWAGDVKLRLDTIDKTLRVNKVCTDGLNCRLKDLEVSANTTRSENMETVSDIYRK